MTSRAIVLKSGIRRDYLHSFELGEDSIRRIVEVLMRAAHDLSEAHAVVFYVHRDDDRFYETLDIEDVLKDPNVEGRFVSYFRIELRNVDPERVPSPWDEDWVVSLGFSRRVKDVPVLLDIYHEHKGWALLLSDQLDEQVALTRVSNTVSDWLLVPFELSSAWVAYTLVGRAAGALGLPTAFGYAAQASVILAGLAGAFVTLDHGKTRAAFLRRFLGPESVFLWGAQAQLYTRRQARRSAVFWGVIVAFVVSLAANLMVQGWLP